MLIGSEPNRMTRLRRTYQSLKELGVEVEVFRPYTVPSGNPRTLKGLVRYLLIMFQLLLLRRDTYHFFNVPDVIGLPLTLKRGDFIYDVRSPWFSSVLETLGVRPLSLLAGLIERFLTRHANLVLTANTPLAKRAKQWGARHVMVVPNYPPTDFAPTKSRTAIRKELGLNSEFVVLYLGKISKVEGSELLKKIIADCSDYPRIKFLIVGDGPQKKSLSRFLKTHALEKNTILLDWVPHPEVPNYIEAADLCLLPRTWSSFSPFTSPENVLKTGEYLALGKPVIAPNMGGFATAQFPVIAVHPEKMGQAILDFVSNPRAVGNMDRPTWEISHKKLQTIYRILDALP